MAPEIPGTRIQRLLGEGACGEVYHGVREGGVTCAIKVLNPAFINPEYLHYCYEKLHGLSGHQRLMPLLDFQPARATEWPFYVMPFTAERTGGEGSGKLVGRTLERWCGQMPSDMAWRLILEISEAMAFLHTHAIIHCNLKPSNVFLTSDEVPHALVADWGQGWLAGVEEFALNDHAFYAPPEQLREPTQIDLGVGEKWDVYAFGVLAWRLLTGVFPRGQAVIEQLRGEPPEPPEFAAIIESEPDLRWPTPPADEVEQRRREIIEKCLQLAPLTRWVDMREVRDALGAVDHELNEAQRWREAHAERENLIATSAREKAQLLADQEAAVASSKRKLKTVLTYATIATAAAAGMALSTITFFGLYRKATGEVKSKQAQLDTYDVDKKAGFEQREAETAKAKAAEAAANEAAKVAQSNLQRAQEAANLFFSSFVEASRQLPASAAGDRARLMESANHYFTKFIERAKSQPDLAEAALLARCHLAEVTLSLKGVNEAATVYDEARKEIEAHLTKAPNSPQAELLKSRSSDCALAAARLRLGAGQSASDSLEGIRQALASLETIPANKSTPDQLRRRADAELLLAQAVRPTAPTESLEKIGKIVDIMNQVLAVDKAGRPSDKLMLAKAYFERGQIERELKKQQSAIETQIQTAELLLECGDTPEAQWQLALCYGETGEMLDQKGEHKDAARAHGEAVKLLSDLTKGDPGRDDYRYQLARRYGDIALILRDANDATRALDYWRGSVELMKGLLEKTPGNPVWATHLAQRKAELADLLAALKIKEESLTLAREAVTLINPIKVNPPKTEGDFQMALNLARVYGAAAEVIEESQKAEAITAYNKSLTLYNSIAAAREGEETAARGIAWTQERLAKLK